MQRVRRGRVPVAGCEIDRHHQRDLRASASEGYVRICYITAQAASDTDAQQCDSSSKYLHTTLDVVQERVLSQDIALDNQLPRALVLGT